MFNLNITFFKKILPGQHFPSSAQTNQAFPLFLLFRQQFYILKLQVIYAMPTFPIGSCSGLHSWGTKELSILCSAIKPMKRSAFIPTPKKGNAKECPNYHTIALISHTSKVMLKILQARLQQYMNHELPDVQAGFRKGRGTKDQIAIIC